jgi:hypothetical protein
MQSDEQFDDKLSNENKIHLVNAGTKITQATKGVSDTGGVSDARDVDDASSQLICRVGNAMIAYRRSLRGVTVYSSGQNTRDSRGILLPSA